MRCLPYTEMRAVRLFSIVPILLLAFAASVYGEFQIVTSYENGVLYTYSQQRLAKVPTPTPIPTFTPTPTPTSAPKQTTNPVQAATQVSEYTWTMKVANDDKMATPQEVLSSLNYYRQTHGVGQLSWDQELADFAQSRADYFATRGGMDEHAGFRDFMENQDGFNKVGFNSLGENSAYLNGGQLEGVHLIEWLFAGDPYHNANQLNTEWTHVGIGIKGSAVEVVFGGRKQ